MSQLQRYEVDVVVGGILRKVEVQASSLQHAAAIAADETARLAASLPNSAGATAPAITGVRPKP